MLGFRITDWDNAYANGPNIPGGDRWPAAWVEPAAAYREHLSTAGRAKLDIIYGEGPRNRLDLFLPDAIPKGLLVFIHGGYWKAFDKSYWSHLAAGAVENGYAVVMPSYTLCPEVRIGTIATEVAAAIGKAAELFEGPILLAGHSAGGHLVSRMIAAPTPLAASVVARVRHVVSISGLHDLRPIMLTAMNQTLAIDEAEALAQSPALLRPVGNARITCWVGGGERAAFIRQNALLANIWTGLGAVAEAVVEPDRHHFNVIDGLTDPDHPLTRRLIEG